jgi:hypothetical protein
MANENVTTENRTITAYQGRLFTVALKSNFGSTNIGWCITHLPKGVALLAEETVHQTNRAGGPVDQKFYLVAIDDVKKVSLEFRLVAHLPTIRKEEVHGTVTIDVEVHPYDEKADISKGRFVEYSENSATVSAVQDNDCTPV